MLDIREIVTLLNLEYDLRGDSLSLVCPLPDHADTRASFKIWVDQGRFYCFGCEGRGDALDLYAKVQGISKEAAAEEIEKLTGKRVIQRKPPRVQPLKLARAQGETALAQLRGEISGPEHARIGEKLDKICWAYQKELLSEEQLQGALTRFLKELPAPGKVS